MQKHSNRLKNRRINRINRSKKRNIIIIIMVILCLFLIYRFTLFTKTERTAIKVNFVELDNANNESMQSDIDVLQDDSGNYYIELPEKVNGFFARKYYSLLEENNKKDEEENVVEESSKVEEDVSQQNDENINTNSSTSNVIEVSANDVTENANVIEENNNEELSQISLNEESSIEVEKNTEEETKQNENVENENTITNTTTNNENTNTTVNNENSNSVVSNEVIEQNTTNTESENKPQEVTNEVNEIPAEEPEQNLVENQVDPAENVYTSALATEYTVNDRYYLNEEELNKKSVNIQVVYQTKIIDGTILYNQEMEISIFDYTIKVKGYIPKGYYLVSGDASVDLVQEYISDVEDFEGSEILLAYNISITDGTNIFQPIDFNDSIDVSIESPQKFEGKLDTNLIGAINVKEEEEKINLEKINLSVQTSDSIEFVTNELSTIGAVISYASVTDNSVTIDDYESDYNYYIGRNFTDNFAGSDQKIYNDDNLAKVTINYYGYDYSKTLNAEREFNPAVTNNTSQRHEDNGDYRNFDITFNVKNPSYLQRIDANKRWYMNFRMQEINLANTKAINGNKIANITKSEDTYTITGNDWNAWEYDSSTDSYELTIKVSFDIVYLRDENGDILLDEETNEKLLDERATYNANISNLSFYAFEKDVVGYVSADANERQYLFTYIKCIPIQNGNISFDLIDNPYMDRPEGCGFDGWTTHESGYNISFEELNATQTLTTSMNGGKEITINLYANWQEANVVFVSSSGFSSTTGSHGLTIDNPVNSFANARTVISNHHKDAKNASDRELNIVVLLRGSFNGTNLSDLIGSTRSTALTLTSLYNGVDYRQNAKIAFTTRNGSVTLHADTQLDFLDIEDSTRYAYNESNANINHYIIGNCKNLRIGRGMSPYSSTTLTTFAQIQGGISSGSASTAYKLVIETGKYNSIIAGRSTALSGRTQNTCTDMIIGCDYDRANNNNDDFQLNYRMSFRTGGYSQNVYNNTRFSNKPLIATYIKSGTVGMTEFLSKTAGDEQYCYSGIYVSGLGNAGSTYGDIGNREIYVEGGNIANVIGGLSCRNADKDKTKTHIYVKGGSVQNIVGGAGKSETYSDRMIQVTGGEIVYSISGGSNGFKSSSNDNGRLIRKNFNICWWKCRSRNCYEKY